MLCRARDMSFFLVNRLRIESLLGLTKLELHGALLPQRHGAIEARTPAGVASAGTGLLDFEPQRILVAVDAQFDHALAVARLLALFPKFLARAGKIPSLASL